MDALTAEPLIQATSQPRRLAPIRMLEMVVVALAIATPVATFLFVRNFAHQVFNPGVAASLLLANLLPYVALIVLIGRRIAIHRATRSALAGGGRLHVRLVAVFTLMASIPIVLTVIAASVMFQSGVQLWGSERARGAFDATTDLAKEGRGLVAQRWATEARTMVDDLTELFPKIPANSSAFQRKLLEQLYYRSFDQAVVFRVVDGKQVEAMYTWEAPPAKIFAARVSGQVLNLLRDEQSYTNFDAEKQWVVTPLDRSRNIFLYVANSVNVGFMNRQNSGADRIVAEFNALQARSRSLQLQFNAVLFGVALLIVSIATWIALAVADRLVQPVEQLVIAARRVAGGDLAARVDIPQTGDEISTLGNAFNGMTERLEHQTGELRTANAQLESRRMLIEAVMSGVSAGVISIDAQRKLRLINESAIELLRPGEQELVGHPLRELAPELDTLLDSGDREAVIQLGTGGDARTLAVKVTSDEAGRVLTFDDITQQLNDQRRAAWSDVARRIAHEIKNPLTPIQLSAERLEMKLSGKVQPPEQAVLVKSVKTIVDQVDAMKRLVNEFRDYARLPAADLKPVDLNALLVDVLQLYNAESLPIVLRSELDERCPPIRGDAQQIRQVIHNLLQNAQDAAEAAASGTGKRGEVVIRTRLGDSGRRVRLTVQDSGPGFAENILKRAFEPYVTTKTKGTGLGLAVVKKIADEHGARIELSNRVVDGAVAGAQVSLSFALASEPRAAVAHTEDSKSSAA